MVPVSQKKGQLNALIDKINFGFGCLLINDPANPVLPKEKKIEFYLHHIALLTAIKTDHPDGREWWTKLVEQRPVKT
jgi:hypothetical protein